MTGGILHLKREALRQAFRQFAALPCETVSEALLEVTDRRAGGMMAFVPTPDDYFRGDVRDVSLPKAAREVDIMIGTGNPENENLPVWEAYTPDRRACMVFGDEELGVRLDHDRALVKAVTGRRAGAAVKTD